MDLVAYSNDCIKVNGLFRRLKNGGNAGVNNFDIDRVLQGKLFIISGVIDDHCVDNHSVLADVTPILGEKLEVIWATGVNPTI